MTPAVVMEAARMAVPSRIDADMKNRFGLEMVVPLVCRRYAVVKPSNMDVMSGNFFVASSFGVHSRP